MYDNTTSTTSDPYDRLLNTRPVRAARDANHLVREHPMLYGFGALIVLVTTTLDLGTSGDSFFVPRGLGLLAVPLAWMLFYAAVIHRSASRAGSLAETLTETSRQRLPAFLATHILKRASFWTVTLGTMLGLTPIALFYHGFDQKDAESVRYGYMMGGGASDAFIVGVGVAALVGIVVLYYLQFADLEAVLSERGPLAALTASVGLVRRNHRAVFGYYLVRLLITGFASLTLVMGSVIGPALEADLFVPVIIAVTVMATLNTFLITFLGAYHVRFYGVLKEGN